MACYYVGLLGGALVTPKVVGKVDHVRVFAALASTASTAALLHAVFVDPWTWSAMRMVTGFCYAGLYIVADSWLNDRATNETRGSLMSVRSAERRVGKESVSTCRSRLSPYT